MKSVSALLNKNLRLFLALIRHLKLGYFQLCQNPLQLWLRLLFSFKVGPKLSVKKDQVKKSRPNILEKSNFESNKNFGPKSFEFKNCGSKFWIQKNFGKKKCWVQKIFGLKK